LTCTGDDGDRFDGHNNERFGRIDALLNIAGAVPQIDLFQLTDAQWDDGMALKFHGARRPTILA
jgi:3-oxoacyl-[acyl-carrier protein] reductase